jgi:hypothetical protein
MLGLFDACRHITAWRLEIELHGRQKAWNPAEIYWLIRTHKGVFMRERSLTIPEIMLIGGTRVALGVGLGLLIGDKLSHDARKGAGWALLAVGVLTTVPLVMDVVSKPQLAERA